MKMYEIERINDNEFDIIPTEMFYEKMNSFITSKNTTVKQWLKKQKRNIKLCYKVIESNKNEGIDEEYVLDPEEREVSVYTAVRGISDSDKTLDCQFSLIKNSLVDFTEEQTIDLVLNNEINNNITWDRTLLFAEPVQTQTNGSPIDRYIDWHKNVTQDMYEKYASENKVYTFEYLVDILRKGNVVLKNSYDEEMLSYKFNLYTDFIDADEDNDVAANAYSICQYVFEEGEKKLPKNYVKICKQPMLIIEDVILNYPKYKEVGLDRAGAEIEATEWLIKTIEDLYFNANYYGKEINVALNINSQQFASTILEKIIAYWEGAFVNPPKIQFNGWSDVRYDNFTEDEYPSKYWLFIKIQERKRRKK